MGGANLKQNIAFFFVISVLLLLAACSDGTTGVTKANDSTDEAEYTIRLPHIVATDNPAHKAAEGFKEEVEKESNGRIAVEIFPTGELYDSDRELIEALQLNNIEMSMVGTPSLGNFDERFYVLDLPFIFKDRIAPRKALAGELGDELSAGLDDINLKVLAFGYDGFRHVLNSKKPIKTVDDMNGLKVRVQESEIQEQLFNEFGANASPLAYGELYSALQQNIYDGMDAPFSLVDSGKFNEVQGYMSLTAHQYSGLVFLMSADKFNEMPEDLQDVLTTAGENLETVYYDLVDEEEDTIRADLEDSVEINEISDDERKKFIEAAQPVYDKFSDVIGEDLIELAKEANDY